jgi:hypothetical protein
MCRDVALSGPPVAGAYLAPVMAATAIEAPTEPRWVRAFRRGVIRSPAGGRFTLDDSPMLFTLTALAQAGVALYFAYLAAGYEAAGFIRWIGWQ